ncbi:cuticle protein CP1876-like [Panulirus ornatus]|uniref:cuticle protein CP1876-like n=1 Tax=Panulirus ornatus TaxID=150431 RepID=UPI003A8BEDFB
MRALVVLAVLGLCSAAQVKWTGPFAADLPASVPGASPQVPDTADVTAARNQFFSTYKAQISATAPEAIIPDVFHVVPGQPKWTGPLAADLPASVPGALHQVPDTADVAAAKQAFFNTYKLQEAAVAPPANGFEGLKNSERLFASNDQFFNAYKAQVVATVPQTGSPIQYHAAPSQRYAQAQPKWTGPVAATIPAGLPGSASQVADTPEVAAAKHAFFSTYQQQAAAAAPPSPTYY